MVAPEKYGPSTKVYTGVTIEVQGLAEVQAMLAKVADKTQANKVLQQATNAGAKVMRGVVLFMMPPDTSPGYPTQHAGDLRRALWVHRASRRRPATVVGHHVKKAFYWPMVVAGTQEHRIRWSDEKARGVQRSNLSHGIKGGGHIKHPGAKANPFIARAAVAGESAAMAAVEKVVGDYLNSL